MTHPLHRKVFASYTKVPSKEWTWKNFSPREVACKGTGTVMVDANAMDALQRLRDRIGRPLLLTSAYRSASHNRRVGGAPKSLHLEAKAFDVRMENQDPHKFVEDAKACGFTGIGYYPKQGFIHIDTGPARTWGTPFPKSVTVWPSEPEQKTSVGESSTVGAAGAGILTAVGTTATAASQLDGTTQLVFIAMASLVALAFIWIIRERIKKLVDAD